MSLKVTHSIRGRAKKFIVNDVKSEDEFNLSKTAFESSVEINGDFQRANYSGCNFVAGAIFKGRYRGKVIFNECKFNDSVRFDGSRLFKVRASHAIPYDCLGENTPVADSDESLHYKIKAWIAEMSRRLKNIIKSSVLSVNNVKNNIKNNYSNKVESIRRGLRVVDKSKEIPRLFHQEVDFINVEFVNSTKVLFDCVDMMNMRLQGTNMRGVRLYDVDFYQEKLKRSGIYDEIYIHSLNDKTKLHYELPRVESSYRNLRASIEDSKDYDTATDFYVGEMEAKRQQLSFLRRNVFSVVALYKLLSVYGSSPLRAFLVMVALFGLHFAVSSVIISNDLTIGELAGNGVEVLLRSLKVSTLQKVNDANSIPLSLGYLDSIYRVLTPVQIALFGLAVRARIKRN